MQPKPGFGIVSKTLKLKRFGVLASIDLRARAATAGKAAKDWSLPRFWVSLCYYKKQPFKEIWGRILDFAWLKFAVADLDIVVGLY